MSDLVVRWSDPLGSRERQSQMGFLERRRLAEY